MRSLASAKTVVIGQRGDLMYHLAAELRGINCS